MVTDPSPAGPAAALTVPYATYLRVYEPLVAFAEPERSHWARYGARSDIPTYQDELRRSLAGLLSFPPVAVPAKESADAFVAEWNGVLVVCPWRTRLRGWLALEELATQFPAPVLDAALPPVVRQQAVADYEQWRERNPDARPWIRSAAWQVPLRWFVLFSDEERRYEEGVLLRYRTPMVQARRRVARALRTLRAAEGQELLVEGLVEVGRWLEEFHPRALVELDYGGLVHALAREQLAADHSAGDLAAGLGALAAGDSRVAQEAWEGLAERWRLVRERLFAN
ncbi:hypothetical protein [Streptomyces sp. NPDC006879]|uniref:hypothetical protein n=1 Tax=Streptomyces sp. NPDC006879 TaxID=3364767 RepID=UPI00369CBED9